MAYKIMVNGRSVNVQVPGDTPLLWVLRDHLGLTGAKYGCGIGSCGACTVHINGEPVRACSIPIEDVKGKVTTIEGLSKDGSHPVQQAWIELDVPQCGYCQGGQIMAAVALISRNKKPTEAEINAAMDGNICRCGTYVRIRQAVVRAAEIARATPPKGGKK